MSWRATTSLLQLLESLSPCHGARRVTSTTSAALSTNSRHPASFRKMRRGIADVASHKSSCCQGAVAPSTNAECSACCNTVTMPAVNDKSDVTKEDSTKSAMKSSSASPGFANVRKQFYRRPLPDICVSFSSPEGITLFAEALAAGHMNSYFPLASQFRTQDEPAFCGLTTLVMALNSLEVDPHRIWKGPWRYYHENMLDCCVPLATVEHSGITMDQFACLAACNTLHVRMVRVDADVTENDFRKVVFDASQGTEQVVISSYSRQAVQQTGDGHFSPIGGYHPGRDMVLIMDTARFKYPPHWITLSLLFSAMQRLDKTSGLPRGYFVLSKSRVRPALLFHLSSTMSPMSLEQKQSSVVSFLQAWQLWLLTSVSPSLRSPADIVRFAAGKLIELVDVLDDDSFLLATYIAHATDDESEIVHPMPPEQVNGKFIRRLVFALEQLPIYHLAKEVLLSANKSNVNKVGRTSILTIAEQNADKNPKEKSDQIDDSVVEGISSLSRHSPEDLRITGTHFVAMLLLSWPYHRCSHNTFGVMLQKYMSSQWRLVSSVTGVELVQNEASRLRQQLATLLNYAGTVRCADTSK